MTERTLPHSEEAENSVIGGLLFAGRAFEEIDDRLAPGDFYDPKHEAIFEAMQAVYRRSSAVDLITVAEELRRTGRINRLNAVGQEAYLSQLSNQVATAVNIQHHVDIIRDRAQARALIQLAERLQQDGYSGQLSAADMLAQAQAGLSGLEDKSYSTGPVRLKTGLNRVLKRIQKRMQDGSSGFGITWGLTELDELTSGRREGRLEVVGGRPGHGKSALALGAALAGARAGHPALLFSIEMELEEVSERAIASEGRMDGRTLRHRLTEDDWVKVNKGITEAGSLPVWIYDDGGQDIYSICARARRWRRKEVRPEVTPQIVVDYVQLISASKTRGKRSREEEVGEISRGLKSLAKELQCPVLAVASLNRESEKRPNKRPTPADLRESGSIESDADLIGLVYRDELHNPESEQKGVAEILIGKNRHGPTGVVYAAYIAEQTRFADLSTRGWRPKQKTKPQTSYRTRKQSYYMEPDEK